MARATQKVTKPEKMPNPYRPNLWGMLQTVLTAAINRGQLLAILICIFSMTLISKMPPNDLAKLADLILHHTLVTHLLGWVISVTLLFIIYYGFKYLRARQTKALNRLAAENAELQRELINQINH